jgi:uncharacterized protein YcgI (DUF1989 family)
MKLRGIRLCLRETNFDEFPKNFPHNRECPKFVDQESSCEMLSRSLTIPGLSSTDEITSFNLFMCSTLTQFGKIIIRNCLQMMESYVNNWH